MWGFTIQLAALVALATAASFNSKALPSFRIAASRSKGQAPAISVRFANGMTDTMELLPHNPVASTRGVSCSFLGELKGSKSPVAVTGCLDSNEDTLSITMYSPDSTEATLYSVDAQGNVEEIESPFVKGTSRAVRIPERSINGFHLVDDDEMEDDEIEAAANAMEAQASNTVNFPTEMNLVVKVGYEKSLKNKVGATSVATWINEVMTHTQAHLFHTSLNTRVKITVLDGLLYKDATWTADNDLYTSVQAGKALDSNAAIDAYVWFCYDPQMWGTVGIAYVGAVCSSNYKGSLNEWRTTTSGTGSVVAHEIGHNLGMSHDFDDKHKGKGCTGLMDYGSPPQVWSSCSVSDFWTHYSTYNWGSTCLTASGAAPANCKSHWIGDGYCDDVNNVAGCQFDGGDCCNNTKSGWNYYCTECKCKQ